MVKPLMIWQEVQQIDRHLQLLLLALLAVGFVAMTSASVEHAASRYGDTFFFAKRYGMHFTLALALSAVMYLTPIDFWEKTGWLWLLIGFLLLALVLVSAVAEWAAASVWRRVRSPQLLAFALPQSRLPRLSGEDRPGQPHHLLERWPWPPPAFPARQRSLGNLNPRHRHR